MLKLNAKVKVNNIHVMKEFARQAHNFLLVFYNQNNFSSLEQFTMNIFFLQRPTGIAAAVLVNLSCDR